MYLLDFLLFDIKLKNCCFTMHKYQPLKSRVNNLVVRHKIEMKTSNDI